MIARAGNYPSFKGAYKTFRVSCNTNRENGTQDRLVVYSQGSRPAVVKYLWLKYLWDELTKEEFELFLYLPEILNDELRFAALRAVLLLGKKELRKRILDCPILDPADKPLREIYLGYKRLSIEIHRESRKLPKVPKFSGWVRSSSAIGSKRQRGPGLPEPLTIIENDYEDKKFDWYYFLTVGGFSTHSVRMNETP